MCKIWQVLTTADLGKMQLSQRVHQAVQRYDWYGQYSKPQPPRRSSRSKHITLWASFHASSSQTSVPVVGTNGTPCAWASGGALTLLLV